MGSNELLYLVQILLAQQTKTSAPFSAKKRELTVTATINQRHHITCFGL